MKYFSCDLAALQARPDVQGCDGTDVTLGELPDVAPERYAQLDELGFRLDENIDPLCRTQTQRWERSVGAVTYMLSGQVPSREEIKHGRQIIEALPRPAKKDIDPDFVLSALPYLLILGKTTLQGYAENANTVGDMAQFVAHTNKVSELKITSHLCSHREDTKIEDWTLIPHIPAPKLVRAVNAISGYAINAANGPVDLTLFQQEPSSMLSSNMFPEVFLKYLTEGRTEEMIERVSTHQAEVSMVLAAKSAGPLTLRLSGLDAFTRRVHDVSTTIGTPDNLLEYYGINSSATDANVAEVVTSAISELRRFVSFYDRDERLTGGYPEPASVLGKQATAWFFERAQMSGDQKALEEIVFCAEWGRMNAQNGAVGIGIDRDHAYYKGAAYNMGAVSVDADASPVIYARRVDKEIIGHNLNNIAIRQFWR